MEISSESTEESSETNYQNILFEAYASIGEPDAVYGCGVSTELKARIHTYEQEKHWGKALSKFGYMCKSSMTILLYFNQHALVVSWSPGLPFKLEDQGSILE